MKRRPSLEFDSLELLLDTICNTFGGILFLAVLVIILLHRAGQTINPLIVKENDPTIILATPADLEERQAELQSLQRAFQEYQTTLAALEAQQSADRSRHVLNLRSVTAELSSRRIDHMRQFSSLSQQVAELEQLKQQSATAVATATKEAKSLEEQLEIDRKNRTRTANLPMLRQTSKQESQLSCDSADYICRSSQIQVWFHASPIVLARSSSGIGGADFVRDFERGLYLASSNTRRG